MKNKPILRRIVFSKSVWLILLMALLASSYTANIVNYEEMDSLPQPAAIHPVQEEALVPDVNPGVSQVYGKAEDSQLNWENKPADGYSAMLVDAVPFLTVESDLSDLTVYAENKLQTDGLFKFDLPQLPADEGKLQIMALMVENQDCLIQGSHFFYCWDAELSSLHFKDVSQTQIDKGQLLVWAADEQQTFPQQLGADGLFFTDDDEVKTLEFGYTLVDVGTEPFTFVHEGEHEIALFSNYDPSVRDLSALSYTEAFETIFTDMKSGYAFNGLQDKEPNWDEVYAQIFPLVQTAEENEDVNAWVSALNDFTQKFSDSHVRLQGEPFDGWVKEKTSSGYGFMLTKQSNGDFVIGYHDVDNPDEVFSEYKSIGDKMVTIDKISLDDLTETTQPIYGSYSSQAAFEMAQARDFTRAAVGKVSTIKFEYHDGYIWPWKTTAYEDGPTYEEGTQLPISEKYYPIKHGVYDSEIGYIAIYANEESPEFLLSELDAILAQFSEQHISKVIMDLRFYATDTYLNLAGYFSEEKQAIAEMNWQTFGNHEGKSRHQVLQILPQENAFEFDDIAVMISENCQFACEVEAYTLSQLENVTLYGSLPTYGSAAIVEQAPYQLPGGLSFNYSTGKYINQDGTLLIEGTGVQPDEVLNKFYGTIQLINDWQLELVENYLLFQDEMQIDAQNPPTPVELTKEEMIDHVSYFPQRYIRYMAVEDYPTYEAGETVEYTVFATNPDELIVGITYCPYNYIYTDRGKFNADPVVTVDGETLDESYFVEWDTINYWVECYNKLVVLNNWEPGVHHVQIDVAISYDVFDKDNDITKGNYTDEFTVVVRENK